MRPALLCTVLILAAGHIGCSPAVDPEISVLRQQLVLSSAPSGETSISSIRKTLQAPDAAAAVDVVLRGRIWAGSMPPWEDGKAAFVLTDATGHDGDEDHDPHTCPFCSRSIDDYLAAVRFRNDTGDVIPIDSRKLFDVTEKQTVIITGRGSMKGKTFQVAATNIFVVR